MQKKVSAAAFRLKGGGWYETDFKSGPKKNIAGKNVAGDEKARPKSKDNKKAQGTTTAKKKSSGDSSKSKKVKN